MYATSSSVRRWFIGTGMAPTARVAAEVSSTSSALCA
jgi:hypothetical protein